jgi:hypothetical protein
MEMRDAACNAGKMCASQAAAGSDGTINRAMWLDVISLPSGKATLMPGVTLRLSVQGAFVVR